MKRVAHSSLLDDLPKRVIDQKAETIEELADNYPCSKPTMASIAKTQVANGRWEQVYKQFGRRLVPAYRRKGQL